MKTDAGLSENMEDYLETILALEETNKVARAKDIANALGIKPGSVTGALKTLRQKGYVNYSPYSFITLTPKGTELARDIRRRHAVLKDFLVNILQVDSETADATACRMEHAIDPLSLERLINFVDFLNACPKTRPDWLHRFQQSLHLENPDWGNREKGFAESGQESHAAKCPSPERKNKS